MGYHNNLKARKIMSKRIKSINNLGESLEQNNGTQKPYFQMKKKHLSKSWSSSIPAGPNPLMQ